MTRRVARGPEHLFHLGAGDLLIAQEVSGDPKGPEVTFTLFDEGSNHILSSIGNIQLH